MSGRENWRQWPADAGLWYRLGPMAKQMRRAPTTSEDRLWQVLRNRQALGFRFRRQHAIGQFVVDFYCAEARLVIEVDGPIHHARLNEDAARQEYLEARGFRVLRFANDQVLHALDAVVSSIEKALLNSDTPKDR